MSQILFTYNINNTAIKKERKKKNGNKIEI